MKWTKYRLPVSLALTVLWLCVIWGNSLLSGEESSQVSGWAGAFIGKILPLFTTDTEKGMLLLRKIAHFSEFAVLGGCLWWACRILQKPWQAAALWGVAAAVIDETIQRFVPGRHGCLTDVFIDTAGVLAGVGVLSLLLLCLHRRKR